MRACMSACIYTFVCVYIHASVYVWVHVCVCVCVLGCGAMGSCHDRLVVVRERFSELILSYHHLGRSNQMQMSRCQAWHFVPSPAAEPSQEPGYSSPLQRASRNSYCHHLFLGSFKSRNDKAGATVLVFTGQRKSRSGVIQEGRRGLSSTVSVMSVKVKSSNHLWKAVPLWT